MWVSNHFTIGVNKIVAQKTIFPHPVGIVIGAGVELGFNCIIYQNVTIGAKRLGDENYPKLGRNVVVYPGAIIVGSVEIGKNCIIGANSFVNKSFPDNSIIVGNPARSIR